MKESVNVAVKCLVPQWPQLVDSYAVESNTFLRKISGQFFSVPPSMINPKLGCFWALGIKRYALPNVAPMHRTVTIDFVVVIEFRDNKVACERIYWDHASVLRQVGLLAD
jgi:hypothetical protein